MPPVGSDKVRRLAERAGVGPEPDKPFLLGLHEVTNEHYYDFYKSETGKQWAIEEVTRAASKVSHALSMRSLLTNEYHLYFWESEDLGYGPSEEILRHPVVYVSWYAAADFCNWLSAGDGYEPAYREAPPFLRPSDGAERHGFRLPTASEWWWAAQGTNMDAEYPWELLPYDAATPEPECEVDDPATGRAREWFCDYRAASRSVLLDSGRRSAEVAFDEDVGPLGAVGIIGNVKEWVEDIIQESGGIPLKALVCGGTGHLGETSFRVGYYATLFPENTNPDVGFRVARSLSTVERDAFVEREREIADKARGWT
jgi:formylglycine-generating enzyme required for sulfatase activity